MSFIPNAAHAVIPAGKLTYLLVNDPGKAGSFRRFGFDPGQPQELARTLHWHACSRDYDRDSTTVHGRKYIVRCSAPSPDRRDPCIVTVVIDMRGARFGPSASSTAAARFCVSVPGVAH